ncbi:hypothetical protein LLS1_28510 [Leifsonia sp. LS1]|uniref:hypothetical protein n=1 Tax=unclassified Leifsonia TaxID=2663824 RepID=UPI001CBC6A9C|nr:MULTISPECIES: hypothetical protein [unclassified Leifsonia]UAJ80731.1 hypothetical protein IT072_06885 [Leifsonia sp. ZF2019]GIT81182.1 hypothetical protein LLS1_28510 [Leifsonia sp. LS1]
MSDADITAATTLGPGHSPGGIPLKVHLGEAEYAALVRIAQHRHATAAQLVEQLVLHALTRTAVPPPADSQPKRKHTTYEEATSGYRPDAV